MSLFAYSPSAHHLPHVDYRLFCASIAFDGPHQVPIGRGDVSGLAALFLRSSLSHARSDHQLGPNCICEEWICDIQDAASGVKCVHTLERKLLQKVRQFQLQNRRHQKLLPRLLHGASMGQVRQLRDQHARSFQVHVACIACTEVAHSFYRLQLPLRMNFRVYVCSLCSVTCRRSFCS